MSNINLSSTLPAAPTGAANVTFASDSNNNVSASLTMAALSKLRLVTTSTDTALSTDYILVLNGVTTETLPATPASGQNLFLYNASTSTAVTINGNGNNIVSSGVAASTLSLPASGTTQLQWDSVSTTAVWRQITAAGPGLAANNTWTGTNSWSNTSTFSGAVTISGSPLTISGEAITGGISTPVGVAASVNGTAGTKTYTYTVVAVSSTGQSAQSQLSTVTTGNATLTSTNSISVNWTAVTGATSYLVYRTVAGGTSPTTTGKIATTTNIYVIDTGLAGDGTSPSVYNSTGLIVGAGGLTLPTISAISIPNLASIAGSAGIINICPGIIGTDPSISLGGSTNSIIPTYFYVNATNVNFRNLANSISFCALGSAGLSVGCNSSGSVITIGGTTSTTSNSKMIGSDGANLYLNPGTTAGNTYINYATGGGVTYFYNGSGTQIGAIGATGALTVSSTISSASGQATMGTANPGRTFWGDGTNAGINCISSSGGVYLNYSNNAQNPGGAVYFGGGTGPTGSASTTYTVGNVSSTGQLTLINGITLTGANNNSTSASAFSNQTLWSNTSSVGINPYASGGSVYLNWSSNGVGNTAVGNIYFGNGTGSIAGTVSCQGYAAFATSAAPRTQLSVGSYLDIYSAAYSAAATGNSIRATSSGTIGLFLNAYSTGAVYVGYDTGTGGLIVCNGSGTTAATITGSGSATCNGLTSTAGTPTPAAPTVTTSGTAGSTIYQYCVVAISPDGVLTTAASTITTLATGNATLSATNYNTISWTAVTSSQPGTVKYQVYRTGAFGTSPTTTGKIGSVISTTTLNDTGLAATTATPPTYNSTGVVVGAAGIVSLGTVIAGASSNFVTIGTQASGVNLGADGLNVYISPKATAGSVYLYYSGAGGQNASYATFFGTGNGGYAAWMTASGNLNVNGAAVNGTATPAAPTVTTAGTAGTTTYTYSVVAIDPGGTTTAASPSTTITTGNATLSATNYNTISWTAVTSTGVGLGSVTYQVYRTVAGGTSPTTTGKIGGVITATTLNDTGLAATSATAPTYNATGLLVGAAGVGIAGSGSSPSIFSTSGSGSYLTMCTQTQLVDARLIIFGSTYATTSLQNQVYFDCAGINFRTVTGTSSNVTIAGTGMGINVPVTGTMGGWTTYTTTLTLSSGTASATTLSLYSIQIGTMGYVQGYIQFTPSAACTITISFNTPSIFTSIPAGTVLDTANQTLCSNIITSSTTVSIYNGSGGTFPASSVVGLAINFMYRVV